MTITTEDARRAAGTTDPGRAAGATDPGRAAGATEGERASGASDTEHAPGASPRMRARERALLLGTVSLTIYLCLFLLPARYLGVADFSLRMWTAALALTLAVQGLLWWILRRGWDVVERHDPHYLHLPVLGASLLFNFYLYAAPGSRTLLLLAWILVLLFGAGRSGFAATMTWSAVQLAGYLAVLFAVHERIAGFSLAHEVAHLWMFLGACVGIGLLFERLRRWLTRAKGERRRSETTLRESEGRLRQVIDLVPHLIFAKDREGRFILANQAVADAYGTTTEEMLTRTDADFARPEPEVRRSRVTDLEVIQRGRPKVVADERLTDARGCERILETTRIPFTFANSELPSLLGIALDVTEAQRTEEERRRLEDQMQHLQKLESLGVLAGGVAHDFNNILVSVLGNAELALSDLPEDSPARLMIQRVVTSAERAAELVHQLLAYSGQGQFVIERLDLSRITHGVSDLISASISKKARVTVDATHSDVYVEADPAQLHQVLINLMTNASDALGDQTGRITVTTGQMRAEREDLAGAVGAEKLPAGAYAFIEVTDDGCGMTPETRARVFEPFFTTKFVGRGLGLPAVLGIVRSHDGTIRVDSRPGEGTTVRLLLPLAAPPSRPDKPAAPRSSGQLPQTTFLLADDDPAVREFVTETLERSGGTVLSARDGKEAIEVYRRRSRDIALVLLDMTMPEMNGAEALQELRRIRPDVRVVLMSGFSQQVATTALGDRGPDGFLQKPFFPEALTRKIGQVLATGQAPES